MTEDSLHLCFDPDADGTGKLLARVHVRGFAGTGGAYFSVQQIDKFSESLSTFPLPPIEHPTLAGGYWSRDIKTRLEQEHLAITAYPVGSRGQVGVQVRIATELERGVRPNSQAVAKLELLTTYERLARFAKQLRSLAHGEASEAVLEAEHLA